jgi:far upstream element-binding protein
MSEISPAAKNPAFEDALQRAKEIASKIKPTESSAPSLKRPFDEDLEGPDSKKPASLNDPFGAQLAARARTGMMQGGNDMADGMMSTEVIMVPNKMVGLIIGRGGEQITRLQADSGCKIQMAQDSAGMPERQCTLTGPPTAIA